MKYAQFDIQAKSFSDTFGIAYNTEVCTPAPIRWAEYSAMNLPIDNKDSLVFMYVIFLNRLQKYKKE